MQQLSTLTQMKYRAEAAGFFAIMGLFKFLGLDAASNLGGFLGRTIGPLIPGVEKRARANLDLCFPGMPEARKKQILRAMWNNLGRTVAEYPHLDKFSLENEDSPLKAEGLDYVRDVIAKGQGAIFVSGHFANWELMPIPATALGLTGGEIYRAANNPFVNEWLVRKRLKHVFREQIPKGPAGAKQLLRIMKERRYVVMLVDQKMNDGISIPFFGYEAMTAPAAAQLALRFGAPLVCASIRRTQGSHFALKVHEPIYVKDTGSKAEDVRQTMVMLNQWLEEEIRSCPEQWLWLHRRWPKNPVKAPAQNAEPYLPPAASARG